MKYTEVEKEILAEMCLNNATLRFCFYSFDGCCEIDVTVFLISENQFRKYDFHQCCSLSTEHFVERIKNNETRFGTTSDYIVSEKHKFEILLEI